MLWTIAEGTTLEEFGACKPPIEELPKGTPLQLTIETPWYIPIGPLADLFLAEWVADIFVDEGGAEIVDVEAVGLNTAVVHMESDPVWLTPLILAIVALIAGIGLAIVFIKLVADIMKWVLIGGAVVLGGLGLYLLVRKKGPAQRAPPTTYIVNPRLKGAL